MDAKLEAKLARTATVEITFDCEWSGKPAAVGFAADQLVVVGSGWGRDLAAPYGLTRITERHQTDRRVQCYGMDAIITFPDVETAERFDAELATRAPTATPEPAKPYVVPGDRVVTTPQLAGFHIVRVIGAVTELSATSGFTAAMKGNDALDDAMSKLRRTAAEAGANAIVGLTASVFGAKGGVTSAFGGDAVGVLLMGTAVYVEAEADPVGDE